MTTRTTLTECADMAATLREQLATEGADARVIGALNDLERKLRPAPRRRGRPPIPHETRERIRALSLDYNFSQIGRQLGVSRMSVRRVLEARKEGQI